MMLLSVCGVTAAHRWMALLIGCTSLAALLCLTVGVSGLSTPSTRRMDGVILGLGGGCAVTLAVLLRLV